MIYKLSLLISTILSVQPVELINSIAPKSILQSCANGTLLIISSSISPIQKNQQFTITEIGVLSKPIEQGSTLTITAFRHLSKVLGKNIDLCTVVDCPASVGQK